MFNQVTSPNPLIDRSTYYPLTLQELASVRKLRLSPTAFTLLLFIKSLAPFGNKVMFTEELDAKTIQQALDMDRITFWRAKGELLKRQLIEFNDHYIRDCQTVDRSQFNKVHTDEAAAAKVSALPVAPDFRSLGAVATLKPSFQNCNDRALEANQGAGFGLRKSLNTRSNLKTTSHSESVRPTTHPVVSPSRCAHEETASSQDGGGGSSPTVSSALSAPKSRKTAKDSGGNSVSPGVFSELKEKLAAIGVNFNRNLLEEFHQAGVERVQQAIAYIVRKLAEAPGSIKSVGGYLVELLRHGENLVFETVEDTKAAAQAEIIRWLNWASSEAGGKILLYSDGTKRMIHLKSGESFAFEEAIVKYPIPQ